MLEKFQKQELYISKILKLISQDFKVKFIYDLNGKLLTASTLRNINQDTYNEIKYNIEKYTYSLEETYTNISLDIQNDIPLSRTTNISIIKEKLLDMIDDINTEPNIKFQNKKFLYDLKFLDNNISLEIYKLKKDDKLNLVSLIISKDEPVQT